ncbi:MAG: hypothetical protein J4431_02735 [Candidatus Aenigmarchaeota archaeon]|nr:hypothetical protein [Candidatus Aenigmarchaeota archaeon]
MARKNRDFRYYWEKDRGEEAPGDSMQPVPVMITETEEEVILEAVLSNLDAAFRNSQKKTGRTEDYTDAVKNFFTRARSFTASAVYSDGVLTVSIKKRRSDGK